MTEDAQRARMAAEASGLGGAGDRSLLGPPRPVPEWLRPLRTALGLGDLRVAPSTEELRVIARLLDHEQLAGQTLVTMRDGSPWLEVDVAVPFHQEARDFLAEQVSQLPRGGTYRYAIWRYSAQAFRVGPDGAVGEDPLEL